MPITVKLDYVKSNEPRSVEKIYTQHDGQIVIKNPNRTAILYNYSNADNRDFSNDLEHNLYYVNINDGHYLFRIAIPVDTDEEVRTVTRDLGTPINTTWVIPTETEEQVVIAAQNFSGNPEALTTAQKQTAWFKRLGNAYTRGLEKTQDWWPRGYGSEDKRSRAKNVLNEEIPRWWAAVIAAAAAAVAGRGALGSMTDAQIEACVQHIEDLLNGVYTVLNGKSIMEVWYDVGVSKASATNYAQDSTIETSQARSYVYTDAFVITNSVLTPRTPDYEWIHVATPYPVNFNPANPT